MAAPATGTCQSVFSLEVSTNGSSWTALSGEAVAVEIDGGEQPIGTQLTAEGEYALVCASGKIEPYDLTFRTVYNEDATGGWTIVHDQFVSSTKEIYVRWSPRGGGTGHARFTTSADGTAGAAVPIIRCTPPALDASTSDFALMEFAVRSPALFEDTVSA